jgi:hypothetical protein
MKKISSRLAVAGLFVSLAFNSRAQFASGVVSYSQGTVPAADAGYNVLTVALGAPAQVTPGPFGGPVDPFDAAWQAGQIVALGAGGSLTLQFSQPILNSPSHPFGVDFIIFGHAGFNITNGDYSGGGITDGTFYQGGAGSVRVSVSADGAHFYKLNSAAQADGLYPTDGSGNPVLPVNPALTAADFSGTNLAQISALYAGSAGGAGFNLDSAVDGSNQSVALSSVNYVRLDGMSGVAFIDAVSVVPEPAAASLVSLGIAALFWRQRRLA